MSAGPHILFDGPDDAARCIVLAHGAGAPMDTPFMDAFAIGLGAHGHRVARFEFEYMRARRTSDRKPPPDRAPKCLARFRDIIEQIGPPDTLVLGGKSMGGRMASMLVDDIGAAGLVCLGYPFHPPGRPEKLRTEHLAALRTPSLFVQGTRDALGNREEVAAYALSDRIALFWSEDGDHSLKPRKASGRSLEQSLEEGVAAVDSFVSSLSS